LHGDGQYAPESLPDLLRPLEAGDADAVIGSRMMSKGAARAGGMPLYKFVGNKVLTGFENAMFGTSLTEFHSGYRLYSCDALKQIPFEKNTTDYHFDTQILIQLHAAGMRIVERPIPTYYGDEIRPVNGMRYAKQVVQSVLDYQLNALGVNHHAEYELPPAYALKKSPLSSHSRILGLLGSSPRRVLDIACGQGGLGHALMQRGHTVTGIDCRPPHFALDEFIHADLSHGLPPMSLERKFEVILLADVLEHMAEPLPLLRQAVERLAKGGSIVVSLPNAVHWSTRLLVAFGKFDYTNKGILDRTHLRFFTKASAERLFAAAGLAVSAHHTTPVPWENVLPKIFSEVAQNTIEKADYLFTRLRPNVFAYQHLFELTRVEPG